MKNVQACQIILGYSYFFVLYVFFTAQLESGDSLYTNFPPTHTMFAMYTVCVRSAIYTFID